MTLHFLDDVFLLYLPLEPAERIFKRLAFLDTNFCQRGYTSQPAEWLISEYATKVVFINLDKVQTGEFPKVC